MALPGVKFDDIKTVESHPIAIRQCDDFFNEYPHLNVVESSDTAACAKRIQDEQLKDTAAIANKLASEVYGLAIMERRIETNKKNYTRFLILTDKKDLSIDNANKASISFQVTDEVGSLVKVLNIFAEHDINLSKVQSMPVLGKRNQYNFYIDLEFSSKEAYDEAVPKVLRYTVNFAIMGEYRKNDGV